MDFVTLMSLAAACIVGMWVILALAIIAITQ